MANSDHGAPSAAATLPPPLKPVENAAVLSAAEEARTLVAASTVGTLATLTEHGDPWASFVTYGLLGGAPILCVSTLAEHGRNLAADQRASISITAPKVASDPLATARVTLAGIAERPVGDERVAARNAYIAAIAMAKVYIDFTDFNVWILRVERVRWVGGYGRMSSATGDEYAVAEADQILYAADPAIRHLNDDHADSLLNMARNLGGYPDATDARCTRVDRYGLELQVTTPRGNAPTRVGFRARLDSMDQLRGATVELARRARSS